MKQKIYHIIIFLLFWFCGVAYSQNPKADILQQDLSGLFDNLSMIGILGEDCSRIDIHITEVRKMDSREYEIKGISRTRLSVICPFKGKVCVDSISSCSQMIKSEYTEVDGFIYGHYSFAEYGDKRYSGTFSGSFKQGYRMSGQQIEKGRNEIAELKLNLGLKDNSIKQNFFVLNSIEYGDGIIFRERVLDKVLNLYKPEIYKLSDYSKLWINKGFYPYGNEFMIVK